MESAAVGGDAPSFWDQLVAAHNEVMAALPINSSTIVEAWNAPGVFDGVREFVAAVEWSEPFFLYLLTFHVTLFLGVLAFSWGSTTRTAVAMVVLLGMVVSASALNDLGSQYHTELFEDKKTNYFDKSGIFLGAVFVAPLLAMALFLQLKLFGSLFIMMVKVKQLKLKKESRDAAQGTTSRKSTAPTKKLQ